MPQRYVLPDDLALKVRRLGLIAVSLGYGCSKEPFASFSIWRRAMSGAPIRKDVRIDVNAQYGVSVSFETLLHFLRNFQPVHPMARHLVAVGKDFQERRVIFLVDPIGSHRWWRPVLFVDHIGHPEI